jgi:hypothetical protein
MPFVTNFRLADKPLTISRASVFAYRCIHVPTGSSRQVRFSRFPAILIPVKRVIFFSFVLNCIVTDIACFSLPESHDWRALQDTSFDTDNLTCLLKSEDPKIRSLAIFALDHKNDPRVFPQIAVLQSDTAPAYSCPLPVAQPLPLDKPQTWPQRPSTAGELASEIVHRYLTEAGYANFDDYWRDHKDRGHCVSWFVLRLRRIWSFDSLNHPSMDALLREVSQMPSPDRQWTVLWMGTLSNPNKVVRPYTDDELVRSATELGHEVLLQLLSGHIQSSDPDLRVRQDPVYSESLHTRSRTNGLPCHGKPITTNRSPRTSRPEWYLS